MEYATDTYQVFNFNENQIYYQFASSGRFITAVIGMIVKLLKLSEETIYWSSTFIAIICIIISIIKMYKIVKKDVKSKALQILIPILIIVNPFSIELFLFIEKGVMCFGVLMCIYAVEKTIKYFENGKRTNIIYGAIFMLLANCSYQGVVGIFVAICLVYIIKYSRNTKEFIKNNLIVALVYGIPAILDFIILKNLYRTSGRIGGDIVLIGSIKRIINESYKMIVLNYQILPKYSFILAIVFTFVILWCKITIDKKILKFLYIIIGVIFITILPQFMQSTSSIWFVPRSTYPFASLYGIILLFLSINEKKLNKILIAQITVVSIILLIFMLQKFLIIVKDRYEVNKKDYEISMQIVEKIKSYEKMTGNLINKIEIYTDKNPRYTYDGIFATGDINVKAYSTDWSTKGIVEYYLNRELKQQDSDVEIKEEFLSKDWNEFNIDEQVILKNDILILCRF